MCGGWGENRLESKSKKYSLTNWDLSKLQGIILKLTKDVLKPTTSDMGMKCPNYYVHELVFSKTKERILGTTEVKSRIYIIYVILFK